MTWHSTFNSNESASEDGSVWMALSSNTEELQDTESLDGEEDIAGSEEVL